ncbi:MAG TPA: chromosomal replication initiator protein DnaA [Planctomycetes bacterium]|nr:chromosomal replication initiator protein DnaA [Planctomycetota bacterium]
MSLISRALGDFSPTILTRPPPLLPRMEHPAPKPSVSPVEGNDEAHQELWNRVLQVVQESIRREQYETWFQRTALLSLDDNRIVVAAHNNFTRDWLARYYVDELSEAVEKVLGGRRAIEFEVDPERAGGVSRSENPDSPAESATARTPNARTYDARTATLHPVAPPETPTPGRRNARRTTYPTPAARALGPQSTPTDGAQRGLLDASDVSLNPNYVFENYVVGPCNRFAHAACLGAAESPGRLYNPLFLHGSVGLGKTHLLQSLCHTILQREQGARILYLSCETFVNHFIGALENGDLAKFRTKYRNVDLLVVDDIHLLANKERTQEEFFHTFNTLYNAGKQIVLSSDSPPPDIPTLQERLVSRFKWGLVTEIEPPCYETRMAILKRKSKERGRELPDDVAAFLAERIDNNIRELEGAVTKVIGYAALSGQEISLQLVRQCLRELFSTRTSQTSMEDIMGAVCDHFGLKPTDLQSRKRTNAIAYPRQIAMYLARKLTPMSLGDIGGYLGGRDHTTVIHAVRKITKRTADDPSCRDLLARLSLELQGS